MHHKLSMKKWLTIGLCVSASLCLNTAIASMDVAQQEVQNQYRLKSTKASFAPFGLTPAQVRVAYGFDKIPFQGEGQTIAILTAYDAPTVEADLAVFSQQFSLPACTTANGCFKKIFANSPSAPGADISWALASNIAVQWAHAMAPKAKILLIESSNHLVGNLYTGIYVASQYGASVVSMGWGHQELYNQSGYDFLFGNPAVAYVAGIGDTGAGTLYPAVSPNVIAVGGTSLTVDAQGNYISEVAWSETGGGLSVYSRAPAHQLNFPIPNNPSGLRGMPDVAYHADPLNGFAVYSSYGYGGWLVVGGTGVGVAQWAAIIADIRSGSKKQLVGLNQALYAAVKQNDSVVFNDIKTGSNGTCGYYCTAQVGYDYVSGLGSPRVDGLAYEVLNLFKKGHKQGHAVS